jgi:hypothetical protein
MSQRGDHIFVTTESNVNHGDPLIIVNDQNAIIIDGGAQSAKFQLNGSNLEMSRNGGSSALSIRADGSTDLWGNVQLGVHLTTPVVSGTRGSLTIGKINNVNTIDINNCTDTCGTFAFTPLNSLSAPVLQINFKKEYPIAPIVILTCADNDSANLGIYVQSVTTSSFRITCNNGAPATISHNINYFVIG